MNDITEDFGKLYHPIKALVIYCKNGREKSIYVESYDMDEKGFPINAHPLTVRESRALTKVLDSSKELKVSFLKPEGLLPFNVVYINPGDNGYVIWHTPRQSAKLLFVEDLGIENGRASIPALLWKASKECLNIYALKSNTDLNDQTPLFHAPFFNVYEDGKVCMGTVRVNFHQDCQLEEFIRLWEEYFFNSYFSHLMQNHNPVKGNIVQLWQGLVNSRKKFPAGSLIKNGLTIKQILQ